MTDRKIPPTFKTWQPPKPKVLEQRHDGGRWRTSPRRRGYDADWDELSQSFRRNHPFCRFCEQEGRQGLTDVVDHIRPAHEYPHLRKDWANLEGLCHHHHNTTKARMENYARKYGLLEELPSWCEAIANRPTQFRLAGGS